MNTTTNIELTPAELELIQVKRKEEALKAEKARLENEAKLQKEVIEKENEIRLFKATVFKIAEEAEKAYAHLQKIAPGQYTTFLEPHAREFKVSMYENGSFVTKWTETVNFSTLVIKRTVDNSLTKYPIEIRLHAIYNDNRRNPVYLRSKFKISGVSYPVTEREYSSVKTCHTKIEEFLSAKMAEIRRNDLRNFTIVRAETILKETYPNSTVSVKEEYSSYSSDKEIKGEIVLKNGFGVTFRVWPNSQEPKKPTISYRGTIVPSDMQKDVFAVLDELIKIKP